VFGRSRSDEDLEQELQVHLEMVEQDLRRQGMPPDAAAREARVTAGRITQTMEVLRDSRGIPSLSAFWLDTKLGIRMLRKHWGLTLIGGLTLAAAMTLGASAFNLVNVIGRTTLPLQEGDRVVIIQPFDLEMRRMQTTSREDFARWRTELRSVENVSAFRTVQRNLIAGSTPPASVTVAEMSASGFLIPGIAPFLGRFLMTEDELSAAPPALVIGYDVWRTKFAANPEVLGQQVRLDGVPHTIVGVMPQDFAFPVNHQYWTGLTPKDADQVVVFARLKPGVSIAGAHAEVRAMGLREPGRGMPRRSEPRVVPYVRGIRGNAGAAVMALLPFVLPLLLVPPCANMAILIYARTVSRQGEFAARAALGASRTRIVGQIFIEVLVLAAGAAGVALVLARKAGEVLKALFGLGDQPFWMDFSLSYQTILLAGALAVFAAMIAGGIPAFRATGKLSGIHALRGNSNPQLGKVWTALVVAQIALSVAAVPTVAEAAWDTMRPAILGPGFNTEEFLTARLAMDSSGSSDAARFSAASTAVVRKLKAELGPTGVTMSTYVPFEESDAAIEVNGVGGGVPWERKTAALNDVDDSFLDTFGIPLLSGRRLEAGDFNSAKGAVLVNSSFAHRILGGGNPLGRRVRITGSKDGPVSEYEVVGLVGDLFAESRIPTMYRPLAVAAGGFPKNGEGHRTHLILHAGKTIPPNLGSRVREITAAYDPALRVDELQTLDEIYRVLSMGDIIGGGVVAALALCGVLFSVAGIYSSMVFAVVQRRREIGIRSALGAAPWRLITGAFRQVFIPVGIGVAFGGLAALMLDYYLAPLLFESRGDGRVLPWIPAAEAFIFLIAGIAIYGPVRRALRIHPVEALRES
jgi:predicted permease